MQEILFFNIKIPLVLYGAIIYLLWAGSLLLLKKCFYVKIQKLAEKTSSQLDDIFLGALNFPLVLLILASGVFYLHKILPVQQSPSIEKYFLIGLKITIGCAGIIFFDKLVSNLIQVYAKKIEILKTSGGIVQGFIRLLIISIGLLILLESFGISITPILASLGIGSLAIALALQPTLENFFSGIQIVVDKPVQLGHFIRLESGEEGYVHRIGWRSTWIRLPQNNVIVVPNKVLVNSKVLNYYYPEKELIITINLGVHYDSDLEKVENITIDTASEIMKQTKGALPEFKPLVRFTSFDDYSIGLTVVMRAAEIVEANIIKHEFIKRLHKRYKKEGIIIPYPVTAINYKQEEGKT